MFIQPPLSVRSCSEHSRYITEQNRCRSCAQGAFILVRGDHTQTVNIISKLEDTEVCRKEKRQQRQGNMLVILKRLVSVGGMEEVMCKQRFEGGEGVRLVSICGEIITGR